MSIAPVTGSGTYPTQSALLPSRTADEIVAEAQHEAKLRVDRVQEHTTREIAAANAELDRVKGETAKALEAERTRGSYAVESTKQKGYEGVLEVQRAQDKEIHRIKNDGEKSLGVLGEYYRNTSGKKESEGERTLREIEGRQNAKKQFLAQSGAEEIERVTHQNETQMLNTITGHQKRYTDLTTAEQMETQSLRDRSIKGREDAESRFNEQYNHSLKHFSSQIQTLEKNANGQLQTARNSQAQKLAEYSSKNADPFYHPIKIESEMKETEHAYEVRAKVPEYEQKNISVNISDGKLLISGQRRNQVKEEKTDGKSVTTSSYQSYTESFPLAFPVASKELRREFRGDELIVTVPKISGTVEREPYKKKT